MVVGMIEIIIAVIICATVIKIVRLKYSCKHIWGFTERVTVNKYNEFRQPSGTEFIDTYTCSKCGEVKTYTKK